MHEPSLKMRTQAEIDRAEDEFRVRVWYDRCYTAMKKEIKSGKCRIVKKAPDEIRNDIVQASIWKGATAAAIHVARDKRIDTETF